MDHKNSWGQYCILDDEPAFIEISKAKLSKYLPNIPGFFTSTPDEAVEFAKNNSKTLFIIDINLGDTNGIIIYNKIAKISSHARVIFITGDTSVIDDEEIREKALSTGGIDFIEKPVKWHELAIKIKNHLSVMQYQYNLEELVMERTAMLVHADRLATVGTMVSSIVHEVSSPLTFIKANQETNLLAVKKLMENLDDPDVVKNILNNIISPGVNDSLKGVGQIEELLKSFRKFYKQEKTVSVTDVPNIVNEVKTLTIFSIKKYGISFNIEMDPKEELQIKCNKQELVQVLTNIVNNAIDALEESKQQNTSIFITARRSGSIAKITVSNNGPKIPDTIVENIFEPFFTTKSEDKGTGLGLSIVRQILRNMGGDILLSNKRNIEDTVDFIITVPIYSGK